MSSELEARLVRALASLTPTSHERARARAGILAAVTHVRRRGRVRVVGGGLLAAATITAGAGVAATGHLVPGAHRSPVAPADLVVPDGAPAVTALADGRAWVVTASGVRTSRPASAVELSPAGLFVAFGERGGLLAAELDGDVRWRAAVDGEVVRIAWAPYPTYIAYVVHHGERYDLRVIWANGRHDRLIAPDIAPTGPRWRSDTGALDYVRADGRAWTWVREPDVLRATA